MVCQKGISNVYVWSLACWKTREKISWEVTVLPRGMKDANEEEGVKIVSAKERPTYTASRHSWPAQVCYPGHQAVKKGERQKVDP